MADLGFIDRWGEPPSHGRGTFSRDAERAEGNRLNGLACVHRLRVLNEQRGEFVAQLLGAHIADFFGREYHKEIIMAQMEVITRLSVNVRVRFFWHLDEQNIWLAGRWLYYGLYRMLVLTSEGVLLTGTIPVRRSNCQSDDGVDHC